MQDIKANGVDYAEKIDSSLIRQRYTSKQLPLQNIDSTTSNPQTGTWNGPTVFRLEMGHARMVDAWNSMLAFRLGIEPASFEGCSMVPIHLVKRVVISDRSGVELDRCDRLDRLNNVLLRAILGQDYLDRTGCFDVLESNQPNRSTGEVEVAWHDVQIPLAFLSPLFRHRNLLPWQLIDGLTIEITWNEVHNVCFNKLDLYDVVDEVTVGRPIVDDGIVPGFNLMPDYYGVLAIEDITMELDVFNIDLKLADTLRQSYESVGIPLKITSLTHCLHRKQSNASSKLQLPIKQSVTRASKIICSTSIAPVARAMDLNDDYYATNLIHPYAYTPWNTIKYVVFHNGQPYPQCPVHNFSRAYWQWLLAFRKNKVFRDVGSRGEKEVLTNQQPSFVINMDRAWDSFHSDVEYSESSGQRIDGTMPATIHLEVDAVATAPVDVGVNPALSYEREIDVWVEHEKQIVIYAQSTPRVFI